MGRNLRCGIMLIELLVYMTLLVAMMALVTRSVAAVMGQHRLTAGAVRMAADAEDIQRSLTMDAAQARRIEAVEEAKPGWRFVIDDEPVLWRMVGDRLERQSGSNQRHYGRRLAAFELREIRERCYSFTLVFDDPAGNDRQAHFHGAVALTVEALR